MRAVMSPAPAPSPGGVSNPWKLTTARSGWPALATSSTHRPPKQKPTAASRSGSICGAARRTSSTADNRAASPARSARNAVISSAQRCGPPAVTASPNRSTATARYPHSVSRPAMASCASLRPSMPWNTNTVGAEPVSPSPMIIRWSKLSPSSTARSDIVVTQGTLPDPWPLRKAVRARRSRWPRKARRGVDLRVGFAEHRDSHSVTLPTSEPPPGVKSTGSGKRRRI